MVEGGGGHSRWRAVGAAVNRRTVNATTVYYRPSACLRAPGRLLAALVLTRREDTLSAAAGQSQRSPRGRQLRFPVGAGRRTGSGGSGRGRPRGRS